MAVDGDGNLYVADYANHRIAVFDPSGRPMTELPVEFPDSVAVHRRTGAVYVMTLHERAKSIDDQHYYAPSHNWQPAAVVKFDSLRSPTPSAHLDELLQGRYGGGAYFALDDSADPPVLWISGRKYQQTHVHAQTG